MRRFGFLFLLLLLTPLHAVVWTDDAQGCAANLPETPGWTAAQPAATPGITVLVAYNNPTRNAWFLINVLDNAPSANLRDPATVQFIETTLRKFGYQLLGNATMTIGGIEWRHHPVQVPMGGQTMTGVVRYASHHGKVFAVSMLLGGGKEAAQDVELMTAAASVRLFTPNAPVAATPPTVTPPIPPAPARDADKPFPAKPTVKAPEKEAPPETDFKKIALIAGGVFIVLVILGKIVGGGGSGSGPVKRSPPRPPGKPGTGATPRRP
jgi:hypothetical protein